jgi:hypothetical protein
MNFLISYTPNLKEYCPSNKKIEEYDVSKNKK